MSYLFATTHKKILYLFLKVKVKNLITWNIVVNIDYVSPEQVYLGFILI